MPGANKRVCQECGGASLDAARCLHCGGELAPAVPDDEEDSGLAGSLVPCGTGIYEPPERLTPLAAWARANSVGGDDSAGSRFERIPFGPPPDELLIPWHQERRRPPRGALGLMAGSLLAVSVALGCVLALPSLRFGERLPLGELGEAPPAPTRLTAKPAAKPAAPRPRHCSRCGRRLEARSVFCPYCGEKNALPAAQVRSGLSAGNKVPGPAAQGR